MQREMGFGLPLKESQVRKLTPGGVIHGPSLTISDIALSTLLTDTFSQGSPRAPLCGFSKCPQRRRRLILS